MTSNLKVSAFRGLFWSAIERLGSLSVQLVTTILIARILSPEDFGLIGLLGIFIALGNVLIDSGFSQAIIREKNISNEELSSIYYFNIFISVFIYIILFFSAPIISSFFNQPSLTNIARLVFLIFPINALSLIHFSLLTKNINFKILAKTSIISALVSGIFGLIMAFNEFGVWSLVFQLILYYTFKTILIRYYIKWKPDRSFKPVHLKRFFLFSINLLSTNIIIVLFNNLYTLIIGKFFSIIQVGFYNQAKQFEEIITQSFNTIIQRVSYPVLAKIDSDDILRSAYKEIINQSLAIFVPSMFLLITIAPNLFTILLTDKWQPSVIYFQLLCLNGVFFPLHSININILKIKGLTRRMLFLEIIRRIIMISFILLTIKYGIKIMLIGNILSTLFSIAIHMHYCGKSINLSFYEQIKDFSPLLLITIICVSLTFPLNLTSINMYLLVFFQIMIYLIVYIILAKALNIVNFGYYYDLIKKLIYGK